MALVDIAATFEDSLLQPDELEELIKDDLKYRDRQLLRLKDEVLDLEDFDDSCRSPSFRWTTFASTCSITWKQIARHWTKRRPACIRSCPRRPMCRVIAPGVIFCLRQKEAGSTASERDTSTQVNPLQPFFLVYVLDDGNVRLGFAQAKQILDDLSRIVRGRQRPMPELVRAVRPRNPGRTGHAALRGSAPAGSRRHRRTAFATAGGALQSRRSASAAGQSEQVHDTTDFELVTWLVIR